jgi:hypothetical protein
MSNAYLSPILQDAQFNDDGTFLVGGLIWFYEAGTSTPLLAYTTPVADTAWTNPIQLDARGETGGEIWLKSGSAYKIILEGPPQYGQTHGVVISTFDNITGVNDPGTTSIQNWISFSGTPTYLNGTSFYVVGDQRTTFLTGRRLKMNNSVGTTYYGTVVSSSYALGSTTIVVSPDYGQEVSVYITSVAYGFIETGAVSSIPVAVQAGSAASGSARTLWIDYDIGGNLLNWSYDATVLTNNWPINATTANNAATNSFSTQQTTSQGLFNARRTGVADVSLFNDTNTWGLIEQGVGIGIEYNRSTQQFSYGGFTLPNPSSTKYIKLPNGLIAQFGQGTASSAGTTVTFPTTFPTQCFTVVTTMVGNPALATSANNLTTAAFTAYCSSTNPVSYIALGF